MLTLLLASVLLLTVPPTPSTDRDDEIDEEMALFGDATQLTLVDAPTSP